MAVARKWGDDHISRALRQVTPDSWLLGSYVLQRVPYLSDTAAWTDNSDNSSYILEKSTNPHPLATLHGASPYVQLVHQAGDASAVWAVGSNAFCKVRYIEDGITPESSTLDFVHDQQPSFDTPKKLAEIIDQDKRYIFLQRLQ